MKRLVLGLLLASLTLGIGLAAGAVPYLQDSNVIYSASEDGKDAWVLIYNNYNAGVTVNAAYVLGYTSFTVVAADSVIQPLGGAPTTLVAAQGKNAIKDISQSLNKMHRVPLYMDLGPGGYVVLHLRGTTNTPVVKLFEAQLIHLEVF